MAVEPTAPAARSRRALAPDLRPLRASRSFRLLWFGQLVSQTGSQLRVVAVPYQIYVLTGSPLAVGVVGLVQAVPLIVFSLAGGAVADAVDRRRLLLVTQVGLALVSVALAVTTLSGHATPLLLYALTAVGACLTALDAPARAALAPNLVERPLIPAAMVLNQGVYQISIVAGPLLAGIVIARFGLAAAYWIDTATFLVALVTVALITAPLRAAVVRTPMVRAVVEGIRYVRTRPILLGTMSLDFFATFFGSPRALLPFYADRIYQVGPDGLGVLFASLGVGSLLATLAATTFTGVRRQGLAVCAAVCVWGLAIAGFGLTGSGAFLVGVTFIAIAGAANSVSAAFRQTIVQVESPDALRGRVSAINIMFNLGGPQLGQLESGVVAAIWSPEASVISGGLLCVVAAGAVALAAPQVPRYVWQAIER